MTRLHPLIALALFPAIPPHARGAMPHAAAGQSGSTTAREVSDITPGNQARRSETPGVPPDLSNLHPMMLDCLAGILPREVVTAERRRRAEAAGLTTYHAELIEGRGYSAVLEVTARSEAGARREAARYCARHGYRLGALVPLPGRLPARKGPVA